MASLSTSLRVTTTRLFVCVALVGRPVGVCRGQQPTAGSDVSVSWQAEFRDVSQVAVSPDGRSVAYVRSLPGHEENRIEIVDLASQSTVGKFDTIGRACGLAFTPDSAKLTYAFGEGNLEYRTTIRQFDLATGKNHQVGQCVGWISSVDFSEDGRLMATASSYGFLYAIVNATKKDSASTMVSSGEVIVWDVATGRAVYQAPCELLGAGQFPGANLKAAERESLDEVTRDRLRAEQDVHKDRIEATLHKFAPLSVALRGDGGEVAWINAAGLTFRRDVTTGRATGYATGWGEVTYLDHELSVAGQSPANLWGAASTAAAAPRIAVAGAFGITEFQGKLNVIDLAEGTPVASIPEHALTLRSASLSTDGRVMAKADAEGVTVFAIAPNVR